MHGNHRDHRSSPFVEKRKASRIFVVESTGKKVLEQSRLRLCCIGLVFLFSFLAIGGRMFEVAVLWGWQQPEEAALAEYRATKPQHPRAEITDRNGIVLATTLRTASLFANPKIIRRPVEVAEQLAKIFPELNEKELAKRLSSDRSFMWVKRNMTPKQQKLVNDIGEPGLNFEPEFKRIYPHANLLSHVLGYVDVDTKGIAGIERGMESQLRNEEGKAKPVALSVDLRVQAIVREELAQTIKEFGALGGTGVVMDIHSGEIVAMSSLPDFDPHEPGRAKDDAKFNRAMVGVYEMGSTFKTFTVAAALQAGTATMQSSYDATKPIRVARFTINDSHPENRWLNVPEIFAYSSNIGTVKMILDVGTERQRAFLRSLGLFSPVKTELPEGASPLVPNPWREINTMTVSYGHGMAVTPIHLVRAMSALVGDGHLHDVTFLKDGNAGKSAGAEVLDGKNVINIRKLLRLVVEYGTGGKADAAGYRVGGKTGTAEKLSASGGYKHDAKMVSFMGVFPADNPQYAVLVMVDEPHGTKATYGFATGGWVSAPAAGRIISRMGPMLGIRPIYDMPQPQKVKGKDSKQWMFYDGGEVHAVSF